MEGHILLNQKPRVTIDKARTELWLDGKKEIKCILNKIRNFPTTADGDVGNDDEKSKLLEYIYGEDSEIFHVFKKVIPATGSRGKVWET